MIVKTILDPNNLAGDDLEFINEKLRDAKIIIARSPEWGGSPFIYSFASTKDHYLDDIKLPIFTDDNGTVEYFHTAATDGKVYLWHPELIKRLSPFELSIVMAHETYHIVLQHTDPNRVMGKFRHVWAIAVDYVVNAMIEHDFRQHKINVNGEDMTTYASYKDRKHPIWSGGLGSPLYFDELISSIRKYKEALAAGHNPELQKPSKKPSLKDIKFYADYSLYGQGAEEIYDKIMEELKEIHESMFDSLMEGLGCQVDFHDDPAINKQQLLQEILNAANTARSIGSVPAGVEEQLVKLLEPKLSWQDIARLALQNRRKEKGAINDWSRFRRRNLSLGLFSPKKKDEFVRWIALLDTSGSMSMDDMIYGISQLKCLDGRSEGVVVPCDAEAYWNKAKQIRCLDDLPKINIVGRGGTVFKDFFDNYEKKLGTFDLVIVLTDGGVFDLPQLKHPMSDSVWVLTNKMDFKPPFGRVAPLRSF